MKATLLALFCASIQISNAQRAVFDLDKAFREPTPTRERISINGLWRWQSASGDDRAVPAGGWGYLRVPEPWPSGGANAAWYQREITVPAGWSGRRVVLHAEYLNSYALVYVDGAKAGEMRYPQGDVDLTSMCRPGRKYVLSVFVVAMPLKAVMLSYNDTASARNVEGKVARRGLCGDVSLIGAPIGPSIADVKVDTSVRRWRITLDAALTALDADREYKLRAEIKDGNRQVKEFTSKPFKRGDLVNGRMPLTGSWRPEKLWGTHTPQNQYHVSLSLLDAAGKPLDTALPVRFGFREFWIDGRDFYLNGVRIHLSALPLDSALGSSVGASYEATRATIQRYKSFGINFVYTHNYGCEPGAHLSYEEILRAADDEGMLLSFSQPHFGHYEWTAPDADSANGYAQHAEFFVRVAQNHPSVVFYSTSHNGTGYGEDMNPDMIDGLQSPRDTWSARNAERAVRAEAIIRKLDPGRIVYHHASGNLGAMYTVNFYGNWIPIQEMSDWFEHWATSGVKPLFTCEYAVPFLWDWAMYRGWYKGKREFGSAVAPWEFALAEWNAQFLGDAAYRITEHEKANLRWEAQQFRKGRAWQRWDYPQSLNSQMFDERFRVVAVYLTDNWRAFRTLGVSATSPWDYNAYWKRTPGLDRNDLKLEVDWDKLQRPGPRPVYLDEDRAKAELAFHPSDYEPTLAAQALYRNNMPLLAYIAGKPAAFTSKDHNFRPGELVEKQIILINDSRTTVSADCAWSFGAVTGRRKVAVAPGGQQRILVRIELPANLAPGRYELRATVSFGNGEKQEDSFAIDVTPPPAAARAAGKIALFDPKGETALGLRCDRVEANADLSAYDILIIGKGALTPAGPAPDIARVRNGLKVVVFEQTGDVLEKRFGFRVAEYGLRWVFKRVPDHPLLEGIGEEHLRNWRGEATTLPARLTYERPALFNFVPTVKWAGIPVTRVWRAGNRGNVASALIEKPARGNFLPILDGGFSLQYTPLMEYREGKGMVLFCQMDVTGRTESDPAAERLTRNILRYVSAWKPGPIRTVLYAGDPAGKAHLQAAGLAPAAYDGGDLTSGQVLVVGPGGGQTLSAHAAEIARSLNAGARVLAIGLDAKEANAFLPMKLATIDQEHIAAYFEPARAGSEFAGVSPADVHNRDPRKLPLIAGGAAVVGNGVLAKNGGVVLCQMAPWQFDYSGEKMNVKRTFRRVSFMLSQLLANLGAAARTPLLSNFVKPAAESEKRWLDGFYLDAPEEWDDPYRFFRW